MGVIQEASIYHSGGVQITRTLIKIGDASYPVNGVGSVSIKPASRRLFFVLAALCGLLGALMFNQPDTMPSTVLLLMGLAFLIAAFLRKHGLIMRTSSGDQRALSSSSRKRLLSVKTAIEQAVAMRG